MTTQLFKFTLLNFRYFSIFSKQIRILGEGGEGYFSLNINQIHYKTHPLRIILRKDRECPPFPRPRRINISNLSQTTRLIQKKKKILLTPVLLHPSYYFISGHDEFYSMTFMKQISKIVNAFESTVLKPSRISSLSVKMSRFSPPILSKIQRNDYTTFNILTLWLPMRRETLVEPYMSLTDLKHLNLLAKTSCCNICGRVY